jgi:hypothetical protein
MKYQLEGHGVEVAFLEGKGSWRFLVFQSVHSGTAI